MRDLKGRIGSVASSEKITGAMKMISSAKMHKADMALRRVRPFRDQIQRTINHLISADAEYSSPLTEARPVKRKAVVVLSSDEGLCGAFNMNLFKRTLELINQGREEAGNSVMFVVYPIGKKASQFAHKLAGKDVEIAVVDYMTAKSPGEDIARFTSELTRDFLAGKIDEIEVVYTHYKSASKQMLATRRLLPIKADDLATGEKVERNKPYLHVRLGKTVRFSSPTQFMAQRKSTIDEAWPGDIVGLPDNGIFKIGDTLTDGEALHFRGLPSFSPEMFKYIENDDPMKAKQLAKGIDQLMDEGVAQMFVNQFNGRKIIGTVGQLQFEVIQYRLENEYGAKCRWEPVHLYKACWIDSDDAEELEQFKKRKYQYMAKDKDGRDVFLADSGYVLQMAQQDFKHIRFHFTSEF